MEEEKNTAVEEDTETDIDTETDTDADTENEENTADEKETADEAVSDEFLEDIEYAFDDEGNIIIPEKTKDEETDNTDGDGTDTETDTDTDTETEADTETETEEEKETVVVPDERDKTIAELKAKVALYETRGRDALANFGVENPDDVPGALAKIAAEAAGIPLEEYLKKNGSELAEKNTEKNAALVAFEAQKQADLSELHAAYPETRKHATIDEIPNFIAFGKARDAGFTPKQAFAASNPDAVINSAAASARQKALNDTKSHMRSNVPGRKQNADNEVRMRQSDLETWRELFPNKTDKELSELYKKTK